MRRINRAVGCGLGANACAAPAGSLLVAALAGRVASGVGVVSRVVDVGGGGVADRGSLLAGHKRCALGLIVGIFGPGVALGAVVFSLALWRVGSTFGALAGGSGGRLAVGTGLAISVAAVVVAR
jgi:hypothetical protein